MTATTKKVTIVVCPICGSERTMHKETHTTRPGPTTKHGRAVDVWVCHNGHTFTDNNRELEAPIGKN